jgi:subtilisin-like proprotein convertase family protein
MPYARRFSEARTKTLNTRLVAAALLSAAVFPARAAQVAGPPDDVPRADASVRAALRSLRAGDTLDVLVGVREDGGVLPGARERRTDAARRLEAQSRIVAAMRPGTLSVRRRYAGFPAFAARASRQGVLDLAKRTDVAWVTLDAVRHLQAPGSEPQPAQILIGSDAVNARGLDGAGQTIAILDTGVDYRAPGLGGAAFPNAKVVGGADLGDDDADPMDCAGHGTSVASVAAGPSGVAPAARVVALKVAGTLSCDTAQDSDILAALDWVLSHRQEFGIGMVNLSFGTTPFDGRDHGYCDAEIPQYATAVGALNAAGVVFTASAGNEAVTNAISAPACLSAALGTGAVYPEGYTSVTWGNGGGGTLCADHSVAPDGIVCFSNSAPTLALLAPGAFWNVETLGGHTEEFHGTSGAAPAVAGAAALLRQARPGLSPSAIAAFLRATGRPVSDSRNGVLTPRLDILAAIDFPGEAFGAFDGAAVSIPDNSADGAEATANVTGFAENLAGVAAVVQIEHDDPRQLVVALRGPDGTRVVLHDRTGSPGRPINAVYGRTLGAAQSLGTFQGKEANGAWTLEVADEVPGVAGRIRNFAVRLNTGQPESAIPRGAAARVLPLVGRVQGTRFFLSDARVFNPGAEPKTLSLYYVPQGGDGSQAVRATRTVAPGEVLALDDVVGSEFGYAESIGQLTLTGSDTAFLATSRAYTRSPNGTFGVFVPSFETSEGIATGETATANGLSKGPFAHTNAGFTEISGSPATVRMDLFAGDGRLLASATRSAPPNGSVLVTDIVGDRGLGATKNFRIDYTVESSGARVVPFATFVDHSTGDGVFAEARRVPLSEEDIVIAQASHAAGANADFFVTDLYVTNVAASPVSFTVSLLPRVLTGAPEGTRTYTLGPGQTLEAADILRTVFGLQDPSAAGLRIHPAAPARLRVSSRTYVEKFGGTFGFAIPGLPVSRAIGRDDGDAAALQLDQSAAANGFRSNFGMAEVAGKEAIVEVEVLRGDGGGPIGGRHRYTIAADGSMQQPLSSLLPGGGRNVYLRFRVVSGEGRILAYGVSIDNTSGDAIYIPAERLHS